jgi:predicted dehydrogenase
LKMSDNNNISRRNILKAFAAVPALGALGFGVFRKRNYDNDIRDQIVQELGISYDPPILPSIKGVDYSKPIRVGIIGYGIRGEQLMRAAGFAHPATIDEWRESAEKNPDDHRLEDFLAQDNLNLQITGACDLFDVRAQAAMEAASNVNRKGSEEQGSLTCKRYLNYKEMLAAKDIDAVIIATPDHWHAQIAIDAAAAGKHIYVEKGMTRTVEEAFLLTDAIKNSDVIFQLGHQGRQTESFIKAKEIIDKGLLGKISLIEVCTNRNSPNGAWVYDIHPDASEQTIDWEQFQGPTPKHVPFSKERFFRWRCWWDYGTGLGGDLLTHEYDALNQILNLGIPRSCVASGGVYFYKDGREVPDVFQAVYEYPERDLTFIYSATLSSDRDRGKIIMGHDANISIGGELTMYADPESTRYKTLIDKGVIDPLNPLFLYSPGSKRIDAVTSATAKYFAGRGLLYTYRQGKRVDTTHLHIKEWADCIRTHQQPSCNIDQGFQEAITAHMSTIAYLEGVKVYWDAEKQKIVKGSPV